MPYQYYDEAKKIAEEIHLMGYFEWSSKIISSIKSGSTSGEILANLANVLEEISNSNMALDSELIHRVKHLMIQIDEVIK